jgi:chromosome segregation ATPase
MSASRMMPPAAVSPLISNPSKQALPTASRRGLEPPSATTSDQATRDQKVESSVLDMMEKQYQQVAQKLDKAEIELQNGQFENQKLTKDKEMLEFKLNATQQQLDAAEEDKEHQARQIESLNGRIQSLQQEVTEREDVICDLEAELQAVEEQYEAARHDFSGAKKQGSAMSESLVGFEAREKLAEHNIDEMARLINA